MHVFVQGRGWNVPWLQRGVVRSAEPRNGLRLVSDRVRSVARSSQTNAALLSTISSQLNWSPGSVTWVHVAGVRLAGDYIALVTSPGQTLPAQVLYNTLTQPFAIIRRWKDDINKRFGVSVFRWVYIAIRCLTAPNRYLKWLRWASMTVQHYIYINHLNYGKMQLTLARSWHS